MTILTAEKFLKSKQKQTNDNLYPCRVYTIHGGGTVLADNVIPKMLIEFTKLHVTAALKAASISKSTYVSYDLDGSRTHPTGLNKDSILNAYDLNNIK